MADGVVPRTPTPGSRGSKPLGSPPPISSSELTPPPSTQPQRSEHAVFSSTAINPGPRLASPPTTSKLTPHDRCEPWKGPFPSSLEINSLSDGQMRDLLNELIPALGESRLALAHTQLQLNLLSIEKAEAAQRAEAEHDLTRREVEVLQAGSPILRTRNTLYPDPRSPLTQARRHLETSIRRGHELEVENATLQSRLKQAKKVIKHLDGKNIVLVESNRLLRDRIRQNREHFNEIRQYGLIPQSSSLESPLQRKTPNTSAARSRSQNPLDALLMADQILSGDPASVPSTPSPYRALKHTLGHVRGTHSMSSLPTTPLRASRPMTADEVLRTPVNQIIPTSYAASFSAPPHQVPVVSHERHREDRDSTISASENDALTDEDVPASQASQAASSMLRRYPGPSSQESTKRGKQERLVQSRLSGKITKQGGASRKVSEDEDGQRQRKRARTSENIGLGIGFEATPKK